MRYSVSFAKNKPWQIITYEEHFLKIKIFIDLNSEMSNNTQFKNILTDYIQSDILTKRLVLLPADWDKNSLLFTKQLPIMNEIIGYP